MATTPNYGWVMPDPTDFVTDLPADFEIFGDAVDATVDGIETVANAAIPETLIDAAGDLIYGSAADTAARLAIGTAGQVLKVNSGATAPEWGTAGGLGYVQLATGSLTGTSVTISSLSANEFIVYLEAWSHDNTGGAAGVALRLNGDTGSNYFLATSTTFNIPTSIKVTNDFSHSFNQYGAFHIGLAAEGEEVVTIDRIGSTNANIGGVWIGAAAVTSITIFMDAGNFDNGNYFVYGR
jgi:hypothetical protein